MAIRGKVTLDGQPLEQGAILFLPSPGNSGVATGGPIKGGIYELSGSSGVSVGKYSVQITSMRKSGEKVQAPFGPQGTMVEHEVSAIAPRFNTQSTLTFDVKPGDNTADFAVESK
ncbi:MAG TPA: hypothetical protein VL096_18975 [Pirellulaceae bacterium]|nr:hypothetical protein [Pirellulaceae bacterium]